MDCTLNRYVSRLKCHIFGPWAFLDHLYSWVAFSYRSIVQYIAQSVTNSTSHEQWFSPVANRYIFFLICWWKASFSERCVFTLKPPFRKYSRIPPRDSQRHFTLHRSKFYFPNKLLGITTKFPPEVSSVSRYWHNYSSSLIPSSSGYAELAQLQ